MTLELIAQRVRVCNLCRLGGTRIKAVPGEGDPHADLVFIGEGPGYYEDRSGSPFVGPAGELLEELLASINLTRAEVFITNMLKCRTPRNRDPNPGELAACGPYLDEQLTLLDPKVIVAVGRFSFNRFFPGESISRASGKPRIWEGKVIYPIIHPAAGLHNPQLLGVIRQHFLNLPALIRLVREDPPQTYPEQLVTF